MRITSCGLIGLAWLPRSCLDFRAGESGDVDEVVVPGRIVLLGPDSRGVLVRYSILTRG